MAKTISKDIIRAVKTTTGGPPISIEYPEAATQTFVTGELVALNAAGFVVELSSDTPADILGVAADDASNEAVAGDARVSVYLAVPETLFAANLLEAAGADHVLAATDIGERLGIQRVTADSKVYLNSAATGANTRVFTHEIYRDGQLGDTNARIVFNFMSAYVQSLKSS